MIEKLRTLAWFLKRPTHWQHAVALIARKLRPNYDSPDLRREATQWAADHAVAYDEALKKVGLEGPIVGVDEAILEVARERAARSKVEMGGAGDLNLLFDAVRLLGARSVVETGVAYGWSSLAILEAMSSNGGGRLFSVDMP